MSSSPRTHALLAGTFGRDLGGLIYGYFDEVDYYNEDVAGWPAAMFGELGMWEACESYTDIINLNYSRWCMLWRLFCIGRNADCSWCQ